MSFGNLLRHYREQARLTQKQLGKKIGRDQTAVSHLERGERSVGSRDEVMQLAEAIGLTERANDALLLAAGYAPLLGTLRSDEATEAILMELRFKIQYLTAFNEKLASVLRNQRPGEMLAAVTAECLLRASCRVLDPTGALVDRASMIMPTEDGESLCIRYFTGIDERSVRARRFAANAGQDGQLKAQMGVAGLAFVTREVVLVRDVSRDPRFLPLPSRPAPYVSLLCAPLVVDDDCLGVVSFDSKADSFTEFDRQLVAIIAQNLAMILLAPQYSHFPAKHLDTNGSATKSRKEELAVASGPLG